MPDKVSGYVANIISAGLAEGARPTGATRVKLLENARALVYALETPREALARYSWAESSTYAAIQIASNCRVFKDLSDDDTPKSAVQLAEACGADPSMLSRILKHLAAMGAIEEVGPHEYRRTGFTQAMCSTRFSDSFQCMADCITAGVLALPAHLKKRDHQNPADGQHCAFQDGYKTKLGFFDYLKAHSTTGKQFNRFMSVCRKGRASWMDFYPAERLFDGLDIHESRPLFVDIGGGLGHDIMEFHGRFPDVPGRLVLQDLPEVLEEAKKRVPSKIELVPHDMFKMQPIKCARVYYLHHILHDWPDDRARAILWNLIPALEIGFSKVLIHEYVIPTTDAHWESTSLDMVMMATFGARERSEGRWRKNIETCGLKIVKIWTINNATESLIECEVPRKGT
ncbi:o-methyltransferase [Aspergillus candidus]|uniref:O-methyltransferase n=1 Tax=Aspergillus candidus TaxID=41067 RepID=A0A2I2FAG2_ASPCN|nr:o-methyltransferase [Aspergillus candidus]PLB37615.1 o-methyltransferase [Aspergillus candidus]